MKKRLRKKLHKGEYRQFGFEVSFRFRPGLNEESVEEFLQAFLIWAFEEHDLTFGGGGGDDGWSGFIVPERKSATEEDRRVVADWLAGRGELVEYQAGPLVDAWHGA